MKKGIIFAAVLVCFTLASSSQGLPPPFPDSTAGPIDNGAIVLLIAVVGYGYLRLNQKKQTTA